MQCQLQENLDLKGLEEGTMSKKSRFYQQHWEGAERVVGAFRLGESLPLKGCWLRVAAVEPGVLVLTLTGYTGRGQELLEELKAKVATAAIEEGALV